MVGRCVERLHRPRARGAVFVYVPAGGPPRRCCGPAPRRCVGYRDAGFCPRHERLALSPTLPPPRSATTSPATLDDLALGLADAIPSPRVSSLSWTNRRGSPLDDPLAAEDRPAPDCFRRPQHLLGPRLAHPARLARTLRPPDRPGDVRAARPSLSPPLPLSSSLDVVPPRPSLVGPRQAYLPGLRIESRRALCGSEDPRLCGRASTFRIVVLSTTLSRTAQRRLVRGHHSALPKPASPRAQAVAAPARRGSDHAALPRPPTPVRLGRAERRAHSTPVQTLPPGGRT